MTTKLTLNQTLYIAQGLSNDSINRSTSTDSVSAYLWLDVVRQVGRQKTKAKKLLASALREINQMKKEFALSVLLEGYLKGQLVLEQYDHLLAMEDGHIYNNYTKYMKVCNVEVELPVESVESLLKQAEEAQEAIQLLAIEQQEEKLQRMKEAFQSQGKAMYLAG